jgi:glycerophosphoryl diester phosphodiesterase
MDKVVTMKRETFQAYNRVSENRRTFIEGHRGFNKEHPENTLASFKAALDLGLDSVEFDVWLTKDDIPVVIHGGKFGEIHKTTDGEGKINEILSFEMSRYNAGRGETVPTLEAVMLLCKGKIFMNIEIKDTQHVKCMKKILELLDIHNLKNQACISSFQHEYFSEIRSNEQLENIEFGFLYDTTEGQKMEIEYEGRPKCTLNVWYKEINPEFVNLAHSKGFGVHVWFCLDDIETDDVIRYMFQCGVDIYCTNNPKRVLEIRNDFYPGY